MWAAWVVAAIALAAAAFMLRFLIALLREGTPSVCYWVVPARERWEKERNLTVLRDIYADMDCRVPEDKRSAYNVELLENENDAKEDDDSSLIARDSRLVGAMGWSSIHSRRGDISSQFQL